MQNFSFREVQEAEGAGQDVFPGFLDFFHFVEEVVDQISGKFLDSFLEEA